MTLVFEDESGFSFSLNHSGTWAPVGETSLLLETPGRHTHTGIGFITRTPQRHLLKFRFTIFQGAVRTEDWIFLLTDIPHFYGHKVIIVWDHLSAHHATDADFEDTHPDWFEFEYLPAYAPEWNPVEACWHRIKNGSLPNFVPTSDDELVTDVHAAAMKINEKQMITAWFKQEN